MIAALTASLIGDGGTPDIGDCKPGHVPRCEPSIEIQLFGPGDAARLALVTDAQDMLIVLVDATPDNNLETYASFRLPDTARDALRLAVEQHVVFA